MLTRSWEWIFNLMRYTGIYIYTYNISLIRLGHVYIFSILFRICIRLYMYTYMVCWNECITGYHCEVRLRNSLAFYWPNFIIYLLGSCRLIFQYWNRNVLDCIEFETYLLVKFFIQELYCVQYDSSIHWENIHASS